MRAFINMLTLELCLFLEQIQIVSTHIHTYQQDNSCNGNFWKIKFFCRKNKEHYQRQNKKERRLPFSALWLSVHKVIYLICLGIFVYFYFVIKFSYYTAVFIGWQFYHHLIFIYAFQLFVKIRQYLFYIYRLKAVRAYKAMNRESFIYDLAVK